MRTQIESKRQDLPHKDGAIAPNKLTLSQTFLQELTAMGIVLYKDDEGALQWKKKEAKVDTKKPGRIVKRVGTVEIDPSIQAELETTEFLALCKAIFIYYQITP